MLNIDLTISSTLVTSPIQAGTELFTPMQFSNIIQCTTIHHTDTTDTTGSSMSSTSKNSIQNSRLQTNSVTIQKE